MHPALQPQVEAEQRLRFLNNQVTNAYEQAAGVAWDNPDSIAIMAIVKYDRLVQLDVDQSLIDSYRARAEAGDETALPAFNTLVNAVICCAREDFHQDLAGRLDGLRP